MSKKKNFYYVLVFTEHGPKFVTSKDSATKVARWDENEKPLELGKYWAEDLCFGLSCNFFNAVTVCSPYELETQPYRYSEFECTFTKKETKEDC